jgi:hypothetical protein
MSPAGTRCSNACNWNSGSRLPARRIDLRLYGAETISARQACVVAKYLHSAVERVHVEWLSWDAAHFARFAGELHFQHLVRPFLGLGAPDGHAGERAIGLRAVSRPRIFSRSMDVLAIGCDRTPPPPRRLALRGREMRSKDSAMTLLPRATPLSIVEGRRRASPRAGCARASREDLAASELKRSIACATARGLAIYLALIAAMPSVFGQESRAPAGLDELARYLSASRADEIELAKSAAPAPVSSAAEVLVLEPGGYAKAAAGTNGFVCLVERSWNTTFDDPEFWNPRVRAPNCYNGAGARSVLPAYLMRTGWALDKLSAAEIETRMRDAVKSGRVAVPESGAMSYMMSRRSHLSDAAGHSHPHLMFYLQRTGAAAWGANLPGGLVNADQGAPEPLTIFFVPVPRWADGSRVDEPVCRDGGEPHRS